MILRGFYVLIDLVCIRCCGFHCVARSMKGNASLTVTHTVDMPGF